MIYRHTIPVLSKALTILDFLAQDRPPTTSKEIAKKLNIPASTCYRILQTFTAFDWLRPATGGAYEFSLGLLPLLKPLSKYQRLFDHWRAPLDGLVKETQLMAKISVRQGTNAVTVLRVESPHMYSPTTKVGSSFPLAYGSSGACLLSGLDDEEIGEILAQSPGEAWQRQSKEDVWQRIKAAKRASTRALTTNGFTQFRRR